MSNRLDELAHMGDYREALKLQREMASFKNSFDVSATEKALLDENKQKLLKEFDEAWKGKIKDLREFYGRLFEELEQSHKGRCLQSLLSEVMKSKHVSQMNWELQNRKKLLFKRHRAEALALQRRFLRDIKWADQVRQNQEGRLEARIRVLGEKLQRHWKKVTVLPSPFEIHNVLGASRK
uniref:Uncharacterized protein n=1 Tax=Chromera velia CCMP2878 TaxID=1169474 RepID=A0A0G4HWA4_9ALVE|eukprot:Cvel_1433.t1-p1 / transcript=Cvel_1433.t1 / gene=Cvel_1433 / organism=Chromera_velia_CCMP2878 / gene_product=hypothetical protein / transcript_product=hypothetical protein / location=Cvel_scaffold50:58119-65505(+) / protein_length=179 / sequence_SO=supercontig / SO=protein_coding / is_pseudo=false